MAKTLKDLALALINATLILIALCLFLAWKTSTTIDGMIATFARNLEVVAPLRGDVQAMTGELAALRADIAALRSQSGEVSSAALSRLQSRAGAIETRVEDVQARITALQGAPQQLMDQAMQSALASFTQSVVDIRNCTPPGGV